MNSTVSIKLLASELMAKLQELKPPDAKIVLMPDLFLDNILSLDTDLEKFVQEIEAIASRGGGNLRVKQKLIKGGNAANTAAALSKLGIRPYLITKTNEFGACLLKTLLTGVDTSHVKINSRISSTVALELKYKEKRVNIMLSDPGPVSNFNFSEFDSYDLKLIRNADIVGVFNWNLNVRGTEFVRDVFSYVKKYGRAKTFLDCGDLSVKLYDVPRLLDDVLKAGLVDILSVNENEVKLFAEALGYKTEDVLESAKHLQKTCKIRIDLHTADYSATLQDGGTVILPTLKVDVVAITGAGDSWNAADIFAEIVGLNSELRLLFANSFAGYYVSRGEYASLTELITFIREAKFKRDYMLLIN